MGKAGWHPKLAVILRAQMGPNPLAKSGGTGPNVDGDIEDLSHHATHQFSLRVGRELIVQPPQHQPGGTGLVVLHEAGDVGRAQLEGIGKPSLIPGF